MLLPCKSARGSAMSLLAINGLSLPIMIWRNFFLFVYFLFAQFLAFCTAFMQIALSIYSLGSAYVFIISKYAGGSLIKLIRLNDFSWWSLAHSFSVFTPQSLCALNWTKLCKRKAFRGRLSTSHRAAQADYVPSQRTFARVSLSLHIHAQSQSQTRYEKAIFIDFLVISMCHWRQKVCRQRCGREWFCEPPFKGRLLNTPWKEIQFQRTQRSHHLHKHFL